MSGREKLGVCLAAGVLAVLVCAAVVGCRMAELGQTVSVYFTEASLSEQDLNRMTENKLDESMDAYNQSEWEGEGSQEAQKEEEKEEEQEGREEQEEQTGHDRQANRLKTLAAFHRYEKEVVVGLLGKSGEVSLYQMSGDGRAAMPGRYIRGNVLLKEDYKGCVLDCKTAYQLYGSLNILGKSVEWKGKFYSIRGIVETDERLMLIRLRAEEGSQVPRYSHLEIRMERQNDSSVIVSYLEQCQISKSDVIINGVVINQAMAGVIWLPVWVLLLVMLCKLPGIGGSRRLLGSNAAVWVAAAAFLALLYGHFPNPAAIPLDNIPSQWSDFLFYRNRWSELAEWRNQISRMQRLPKDAAFLKLWLISMLLTGTGLILAVAAGVCICESGRKRKGR